MIELVMMAALAAEQPADTNPPASCQAGGQNANPGTLLHLQLRDVMDAPKVDVAAPPGGPSGGATNSGYTRLVIHYSPCSETTEPRAYEREGRWWGKRLFAHKVASKILKINATVRPLGVEATKTLSSISRDSGKTGENWTTSVENDSVLLPYFRSDANSYVDLNIEFNSTRDYQTAIASESLTMVKQAASLIAPTSTLVTAVNKNRFNDAAKFVDSTVDGLLKVAITENGHLGIQLNGGLQKLATITLYAPGANDPYPAAGWQQNRYVGQWTIWAEPLTQSIFAPGVDPSAISRNDLSAASIMNFEVANDKTLKESLTGSSSVQTTRDALLNDDSSEEAAVALCRAVARETDALGFSPPDVGNAVWAYVHDLALTKSTTESVLASCGDVDHIPELPRLAKKSVAGGQESGSK